MQLTDLKVVLLPPFGAGMEVLAHVPEALVTTRPSSVVPLLYWPTAVHVTPTQFTEFKKTVLPPFGAGTEVLVQDPEALVTIMPSSVVPSS